PSTPGQSTATISARGLRCAIVMPKKPWPAAMSSTFRSPVPATRSAITCAGGIIIGPIERANSIQIGFSSSTVLVAVGGTRLLAEECGRFWCQAIGAARLCQKSDRCQVVAEDADATLGRVAPGCNL